MNESREWIFHPLSAWPVLSNGGGLFRWQVGHISVAYFFFCCHQYLFLLLFYRFAVSWLSYSVSAWSFGQHVCRFSPAITHLSNFWGFGNLQNHPVSLKIYASLLIANSKSVLNIKSRRRPTSLYLKRRPYKVILGGIRVKHSAGSLKVFICNFCLPSNASLSWLGTSFFPRVRHLWIRCMSNNFRKTVVLKKKKWIENWRFTPKDSTEKKWEALHELEDLEPLCNVFYTFVCQKVPGKITDVNIWKS